MYIIFISTATFFPISTLQTELYFMEFLHNCTGKQTLITKDIKGKIYNFAEKELEIRNANYLL